MIMLDDIIEHHFHSPSFAVFISCKYVSACLHLHSHKHTYRRTQIRTRIHIIGHKSGSSTDGDEYDDDDDERTTTGGGYNSLTLPSYQAPPSQHIMEGEYTTCYTDT